MVKPPDNPNIGSEIFSRNYQQRSSRNNRRHHDDWHQSYNLNSNQVFYQQCQRKRICENSKHYPYRTWKWLELYRIAYPDPYSGPGPGPGATPCNTVNVGNPPLLTPPAISPLGSNQPMLARRLDDSVVIISPSSLSMSSLWPKSRRRSIVLTDVHKARMLSVNRNHHQRHKSVQNQHRQDLRQSHHWPCWAFSRSFLYFLIALICFDSGLLLVNCDLTSQWLDPKISPNSNKSTIGRGNYNTNSRTIRLGAMDNNYTNFLNLNNSNNRNDIIKSSNTTPGINLNYRTNDFKNIFLNYNDIYTNNDNNYNNNQYYNTNQRNFTSSNSKFNQTKDNSNNPDTSSMTNSTYTNINKISLINVKTVIPKSKSIFSGKERSSVDEGQQLQSEYDNEILRSLNSTDLVANTQVPSLYPPTMLALDVSTVSTIIQQKRNSMKASLNAIKNFKLGKFVSYSNVKKSKLLDPTSIRPRHVKSNRKMLPRPSGSFSGVYAERTIETLADRGSLSNILKNKRTLENNKFKQQSNNNLYQVTGNNDVDVSQYKGEESQDRYIHYKRQEQAKKGDSVHFYRENQYKRNGLHLSENPQEKILQRRSHSREGLTQSESHEKKDRHRLHSRSQENHYDHQYHQGHHQQQFHLPNHNQQNNNERHLPFKSHPTYNLDTQRPHTNSLSDENYRRSILASISCPNCVYNTDPYLTGILFDPSTPSGSSSSPPSSPSFSSPNQLKQYQTGNKPRQLHQHQQHELPHHKPHEDQTSHFVHNSPQYPIINKNDNYHESPKQPSKNTQSNNVVYNYNTINSNSNPFQQSFHQLDSDQIRLESIKHQILSKLGLKSKPNVTQTLPKQFIMETIYRAESGGRGVLTTPTITTRHSDSAGRLKSKSFSENNKSGRDPTSQGSSTNDFFYNEKFNTDVLPNYQYHKVNTESISNRLVSNPAILHVRPQAPATSSFLSFEPTRIIDQLPRDNEFGGSSSSVNVDSVYELAKDSAETSDAYRANSMIGDTNTLLISQRPTVAHSMDSSAFHPALAPAISSSSSTEQDDFYGKTKEIITFAEKGSVLNGHRLIEFRSLSDQMTGQNLRIRSASMWIRVDLRPIPEIQRHRNLSARLKMSSVNSSLKVWVFRLKEAYEPSFNSTDSDRKDFDEITTLCTTQNVQFSQLGWQKLDITETVQNWYANDRHMRLQLLVDCSGCGDLVNLHLFNKDHYSKSKKSKLQGVERGHRRHHYQRDRPLHAPKPNHQFSQKHRQPYRVDKYFRRSTNRTMQALARKENHAKVLGIDRASKGMNPPNFYRDKSQATKESRASPRSNDISKLTKLHLANEDHISRSQSAQTPDSQEVDPNRPFLVIHTEPNIMKRVRRRALDCSGALNGQCCKESFYVSFKALGWDDWIIAPHGYFANYCRGDCAGPRTPDTYQSYHTHVMEEFRKLDRLTGMQPCCAPLKFSSMSLIYYGKEGIIKRDLPKMVVDECGCP